MTTAASRVKLLPVPVAAPGVCALCGSATKPVVDFGKQLDWYGAVYFCQECIREIAEAIGYVPVDSFDKLHTDYRELTVKHDQLSAEHETVKNALTSLLSSGNKPSVTVPVPVDAEFPPVEIPVFDDETDDNTVSGDTKTVESSSIEGDDDFFDASDFDTE